MCCPLGGTSPSGLRATLWSRRHAMTIANRTGQLDERFSGPGATPARGVWSRDRLEGAETYWITTVRDDGRPHSTPPSACGTTTRSGSAQAQASRSTTSNITPLPSWPSARATSKAWTSWRDRRSGSPTRRACGRCRQLREVPTAVPFEVRDGAFYSPPTHAIVFEVGRRRCSRSARTTRSAKPASCRPPSGPGRLAAPAAAVRVPGLDLGDADPTIRSTSPIGIGGRREPDRPLAGQERSQPHRARPPSRPSTGTGCSAP